ncbi:hypothetical protein Tco_1025499, partial [Tanacetum coccineum]
MIDEKIKNTRGVRLRGWGKRKRKKERMARGEEYKGQEGPKNPNSKFEFKDKDGDKDKGAFVENVEDKKYNGVRECEFSCEGISLGRFMWEKFKFVDGVGDEEENNQRIDYELIIFPLRGKRDGQ